MVPLKAIFTIPRSHRATKFGPILCSHLSYRLKSTNRTQLTPSTSGSSGEIDTNVKPLGEKVKETTKTVSYLGVILLGVGVTGTLFYAIFNELFSSKSPNNVYAKAVKKCINFPQVEDKLGYPISAYGEETRRGRRQHVSHVNYVDKEGRKHIRMKFHLKGAVHSGTAHLDMVESDSGNYEYRYLFVQVDDMLKNVIVVEDNRGSQSNSRTFDLQF